MSKVLLIAEHLNGKLNASTAKCVSAAPALSPSSTDIVAPAAHPSAVAAQATQIAGVNKVLSVTNAANAQAIAQVQAPQIAALAAGYSHVSVSYTHLDVYKRQAHAFDHFAGHHPVG